MNKEGFNYDQQYVLFNKILIGAIALICILGLIVLGYVAKETQTCGVSINGSINYPVYNLSASGNFAINLPYKDLSDMFRRGS